MYLAKKVKKKKHLGETPIVAPPIFIGFSFYYLLTPKFDPFSSNGLKVQNFRGPH